MSYVDDLRALVGNRPLIVVGSSVALIDEAGRLLLQRRLDGRWELPGGAMELGESLEQTARREVEEETGLRVGALRFYTVVSGPGCFETYDNGDQVYTVTAVYISTEFTQTLRPNPVEVSDAAFFPLTSLPEPMLPMLRQYLDRFVANPSLSPLWQK